MSFTAEERAHYDEHGYVLIRHLLPGDDLQRYNERLEAILEGRQKAPDDMLVMRDIMVAKGKVNPQEEAAKYAKIQDLQSDPVFWEYLTHPRILDYVGDICGSNIKTIHNMLINKPPNVDGRHPMHQDLLYFPFRPADKIVGVWTALQTVNRENGCLAVIPGSHREPLLDHEAIKHSSDINPAYFGVRNCPIEKRIHVEMAPGDTLFFHPLLIHGSGRNRSAGYRRAISAHYASCECAYLENGKLMATLRHYRLVHGQEVPGGI